MVGFFFRGQVSAVALLLAQLVCMTHAVLPAPTILSRTKSDGYKNEQLIVYFEPVRCEPPVTLYLSDLLTRAPCAHVSWTRKPTRLNNTPLSLRHKVQYRMQMW